MTGPFTPSPRCTLAGRFVLLAWLFFATIHAAQAAPRFTTRIWRQESGLPGNDVTALCQDSQGCLWVSTSRTLARFDGSRFIYFAPKEEEFQSANGFAVLAAEGDGSLLLGPSAGGLLRLADGRFSRHPLPEKFTHSVVTALHRAADGALWIGFKGGVALRQQEGVDQVFTFEHGSGADTAVQVVQDGGGRVWLTNGTMLVRYENGVCVHVPVRRLEERLFIATAREQGPWVFSDERLFKMAGNEPIEITKINNYTSAQNLQAVVEDAEGDLWLGTRFRGLRRLFLGDSLVGDVQQSIFEQPGDIATVLCDSTGNIWAGSHGGGLVRAAPALVRTYNRSLRLVENHSASVCQDNSGTMWFANRDGGAFFLQEPGRVVQMDRPPKTPGFSVVSVTPGVSGGVWLASTHGLYWAERSQPFLTPVPTPFARDNLVRVSFTARDGSLWFASDAGRLARFKAGQWTEYDAKDGLDTLEVRSIAEDAKGVLWLGCTEGRVFLFDGARFNRLPLATAQPPGAIQAIHFDEQGDCWLGTERSGIIYYKGKPGVIKTSAGLPSNNITNIISDDRGSLWFGSPESIFRVRRSELLDCLAKNTARINAVVLGLDEGISEASCTGLYQPSAWKGADGRLWFATRDGVVSIDPAQEKIRQPPPVIRVSSVLFDGVLQQTDGRVRVTPQVRDVSFKYSALCLSTPGRLRTRYKLEGYDYDWTNAPGAETAKYSRLPPGRYILRIEALIAGVAGSETSEDVVVEVEASWWQTLWFRMLVLVAGVLGVVAAVRYWSHKRLRKRLARLEYEAALEQERVRIAKNIHDDLGAGLTRISLLTQSGNHGSADVQLDKIYNTVSELTRSMDEVVWAVNPKNDDLENLAGYLSEFAQGFLSDAGLRCRVLLPDQLPRWIVPAQHRHHLFLACKETLNNIAKHARATEVSVQIMTQAHGLLVVITDDGRGLPEDVAASTGNGIKNMKSRMASIDGTCEITSASGTGTIVRFNCPLPNITDPCN